jgi:anti-anti-sigma regulatory factor
MDSYTLPLPVSNPVSDSKIKPHTIVVQPSCDLDQTSVDDFQMGLESALAQASDAVIVDFLWVQKTDAQGVAVIVSAIEQAAALGKSLSFHAMNRPTRAAMEAEWDRQRQARFSTWIDDCGTELEQFLDERVR